MGSWAREYQQAHSTRQQENFDRAFSGNFAFLPCAPGCRGSGSDPRSCHCVCRGINHGILVYGRAPRPVPVPHGFTPYLAMQQEPEFLPEPVKALPEIQPKLEPSRVESERLIFPVARGAKRFVKKITGIRSQDDLNASVLKGLGNQFKPERVEAIVDQAFSLFYQRLGSDANRPELYELYENGDIDRALGMFNVRWVIGRPKKC